jgi:hypothetical protein
MAAAMVLATLIGLGQPAPENPDALSWEELDEPEAPAPTDAAPPAEAAPPTEAQPPAEAQPAPEGAPAEAAPPTEAQPPAEQPPAEEPGEAPPVEAAEPEPTEDTPPETAVEFTPNEPEEELAVLQPPGTETTPRKKRPSLYGRLWAGPVIGFGSNLFAIGASATYFVIPHIGVGADLVNVFRWGPDNNFYEFQLTPQATLLMLPRRRFSPYFWAGFGLDTFNQGLGTYGRWVTGGGFIMLLGRRIVLRLGVEFDGRVPEREWNQNFTCGPFRGNCTVGVSPVIGLSIPFG